MARASNLGTVSTRQQRIAELAKQSPGMGFTSLAYHIDLDWLREAYQRTRKDGATGVDGQTAKEYAANLEANLQSLLDRAKSGTYRAPPVRRAYIPKGSGRETRPLGIPTFEDKVLQRAVVMALEPIYEQDFLPCSYGYRPGRSAHQALQDVWNQTMKVAGGWIVEVDIRKFFDELDHAHLREFLQQRIRDGVLLRLIGKWLNAGVLEEGCLTHPDAGTPQGGVISPLLANIFLHYVVDDWFERVVKPLMSGRVFMIRYADDFVIGCANEKDARRIMEVLPKRFAKYGLTLHPAKTRLVPFQRPRTQPRREPTEKRTPPGTFHLLGFTHYWGRSWKGCWIIKRQTEAGRFDRAIRKVAQWCRVSRHQPIAEQHRALSQKLWGHYGYYGITGNVKALERFRYRVLLLWWKWLSRRHNRAIPWPRYALLLEHYPLPAAVVVQSVYRRVAKPR
jgi:RNA-directed DNA polymerase